MKGKNVVVLGIGATIGFTSCGVVMSKWILSSDEMHNALKRIISDKIEYLLYGETTCRRNSKVSYRRYYDSQKEERRGKDSLLKNENKQEFVAQLIENVESFLENKGVILENLEKQEAIDDGEEPDCIANIYGSDYGELQTGFEDIMENWKLV